MKSNYKNIDDANKKIDSIIKQFETCQEQIQKENKQLKSTQQELINDVRKYSCQALDLERKNKKLKEERNTYAPNEVFKIKKENKQLKQEIKSYQKGYNEQLELIRQIDNLTNGISFLKDKIDVDKLTIIHENKKLKDELKEANSDVGIFIEEQNQLKDRISNLVSENVKLQNDLFTEQLIQDEQDEYINRLKLELFELYRNKQ